METSKARTHPRYNKRSMPLRHRNILQKSRRQSTTSKKKTIYSTSSVVFIVLALSSPQNSAALISRVQLVSHRIASPPCNRYRYKSSSPSGSQVSRTTSLQYQDYRSNDDANRCQMNVDGVVDVNDTQQQQQSSKEPIPQDQQQQQQSSSNDHQISNFFHTLWTSGKSRRARELHAIQQAEEERVKQGVLDDYLESIDRRYKRLHEKDGGDNVNGPSGFTSALQWLKQGSESSSELEEQRKREDAIYVLGLADLASTSLLQRHHLPIPESKRNKSVIIDIAMEPKPANNKPVAHKTVATQVNQSRKPTSAARSRANKAVTILPAIVLCFRILNDIFLQKMMISYSKQLKEIARQGTFLCGKALIQALGSFASLVKTTSGGKHAFQIATMLFTSVFAFVLSNLRPFSKA